MSEKSKFSWLKDSLIQIVFVVFAIVFTVMIANISISGQYSEYYGSKLAGKAETLAQNSALLFSDNEGIQNADGIRFMLDLLFPKSDNSPENIYYTLFDAKGRVAATNTDGVASQLPDEVLSELGEIHTYHDGTSAISYAPVTINGAVRCIIKIHLDNSPFLEFEQGLQNGLYSSLKSSCGMMALGYLIFAALSNLRNKKKNTLNKEPEEAENGKSSKDIAGFFKLQIISMIFFGVISVPLLWFGADKIVVFSIGILTLAIAALHLIKVVFKIISWYFSRSISGYAAQTLQFCVFLLVFLSIFSYSMQNSYTTQIELSRQDEMRIVSVFAALNLSGNTQNITEKASKLNVGMNSECVVIKPTDSGKFEIVGNESEDLNACGDLLTAAWEGQSSVTGVRGEYIYGITVIADESYNATALVAVRQLYSIYSDELRDATVDFLLAMAATVFAFVFLFVELNRLLEVINTPNLKRERGLRYAAATQSLVFLTTMCRYIPLYFFVLIVQDIYTKNMITWIPGDLAVMLPIVIVLPVVAMGSGVANRIIRVNSRAQIIFGCLIGAAGFLSVSSADNLPLFLLLLVLTYTGVSMVYNGLWDFTAFAADSGHPEFDGIKANTLSGEYLGGTAGAVIGAMVYDKLGLFAALILSAVVLLILAALIRGLLPVLEKPDNTVKEKSEYGFFRFFFSKNIFPYIFLILMPFVLGEYFIEQFSPLYANTISMSPGAASWNSLLMTMTLAYIAPPVLRHILKNTNNITICVIANLLSAVGLVIFAAMPGIATMYAASAMMGISIGIGKNVISDSYSGMKESELYKNSGNIFNFMDSSFGQIGAMLFTFAHILSAGKGGVYIIAIAALVAVPTLVYCISARRSKA